MSKQTNIVREIKKLIGRAEGEQTSLGLGGGVLLAVDPHTLEGAEHTAKSGALLVRNVISPAQLVANTDNWSPTGLATADVIRVSTDASRNLTGLVAPASGFQALVLANVGAFDLVLKHNVTSTAANRLYCPNDADVTLQKDSVAILVYDLTTLRWRVIGGGGGGSTTFGTPAIVLGTAAAAGSIDEAIRRDSTIVAFDATAPTTAAFGDSAATGSVAKAARRDHGHGMPANPVTAHEAASDPHTGYLKEADIAAKGDLFVGTANDTVGILTAGSNGKILQAASGEATGLKWITPAAASLTLYGTLADVPPSSPGTYDEEFEGTADTLPTNWAWVAAPSGSDLWSLNSRWPGMLTVEGTSNTGYTLKRTSFSPAATFGIWAKIISGPQGSTDNINLRFYVKNSAETDGRAMELRAGGADSPQARALKMVASVESAVGSGKTLGAGSGTLYIGITRDGSTNWSNWYSLDGIQWNRITGAGGPDGQTITIDRMYILMATAATRSFQGIDWIRYRTDNEFPRP